MNMWTGWVVVRLRYTRSQDAPCGSRAIDNNNNNDHADTKGATWQRAPAMPNIDTAAARPLPSRARARGAASLPQPGNPPANGQPAKARAEVLARARWSRRRNGDGHPDVVVVAAAVVVVGVSTVLCPVVSWTTACPSNQYEIFQNSRHQLPCVLALGGLVNKSPTCSRYSTDI